MAVTPGRASATLQDVSNSAYETVWQANKPGVAGYGPACKGFEVWADTQAILVKITGVHDYHTNDTGGGTSATSEFLLAVDKSKEFFSFGRGITKVELKANSSGGKAKWTVTVD